MKLHALISFAVQYLGKNVAMHQLSNCDQQTLEHRKDRHEGYASLGLICRENS